MEYKHILVEKKEGVAMLTLNRPEVLNAWMTEMRDEVGAALESFGTDDEVRVVIITGAGRAFCAGHDRNTIIDDLKDAATREHDSRTVRQIILTIVNMGKPVIAMVNGPAAGGGCNLALWCDLIIASENAHFGQTFIRIGLVPEWGSTYLVPHLVGIARANEALFTGRLIDAPEAERIGLINKVVPADELEAVTMKLARELAQGPTKTIGLAKRLLNQARHIDLTAFLLYESEILQLCTQTEDLQEGLAAFLAKRAPQFKGR